MLASLMSQPHVRCLQLLPLPLLLDYWRPDAALTPLQQSDAGAEAEDVAGAGGRDGEAGQRLVHQGKLCASVAACIKAYQQETYDVVTQGSDQPSSSGLLTIHKISVICAASKHRGVERGCPRTSALADSRRTHPSSGALVLKPFAPNSRAPSGDMLPGFDSSRLLSSDVRRDGHPRLEAYRLLANNAEVVCRALPPPVALTHTLLRHCKPLLMFRPMLEEEAVAAGADFFALHHHHVLVPLVGDAMLDNGCSVVHLVLPRHHLNLGTVSELWEGVSRLPEVPEGGDVVGEGAVGDGGGGRGREA
eukprot:CAMPEP_0181293716 /NCGR_PEP_ID=MMETSP1101-20121128/3211_1 /TAXON_ID=46948 /ORGANISM="Rhodomonas abbreviata, Strain Caron Lab Isolate" /LENGTH=304 /DNA_ID=CAMNT_0023398317 /DNA_START=78 /DNA_END=995 /DNA_ORIENTATION=+